MSKLTRAEKNAIIVNESKGIQHPDYYVCTTKTGMIQVRKRKTGLKTENVKDVKADDVKDVKINDVKDEKPKEVQNYDTVTNQQLMEKMLQVLEKTTECKDKNLNSPERERETNVNKEFVEGVREQTSLPGDKVVDKVANSSALPKLNPQSKQRTHQRTRNLLSQPKTPSTNSSSSTTSFRKGRNLLR